MDFRPGWAIRASCGLSHVNVARCACTSDCGTGWEFVTAADESTVTLRSGRQIARRFVTHAISPERIAWAIAASIDVATALSRFADRNADAAADWLPTGL